MCCPILKRRRSIGNNVLPKKLLELIEKNMVYVFDSEDKFELTYDELIEIIGKARLAGPQLIPVIGTVGE